MPIALETRSRSVAKSISWRFFAAIITSSIAWALTGKLDFAAKIGALDTCIKLVVFFLHERAWNKIDYGRVSTPDYEV